MGTDVDMLYFICRDPRQGGEGHRGQMAGITANVQRTGRACYRHCLWFSQSRNSIQCLLLGAEESVCKERWLCNSFSSWENAVSLYVCSQDKGEGCLTSFTELARSGFQEGLGDPNSHLFPRYLSSLRTLWKVFDIPKAQTTKKLRSV